MTEMFDPLAMPPRLSSERLKAEQEVSDLFPRSETCSAR